MTLKRLISRVLQAVADELDMEDRPLGPIQPQRVLYVDGKGSRENPFTSIAEAIRAAPQGAQIRVAPDPTLECVTFPVQDQPTPPVEGTTPAEAFEKRFPGARVSQKPAFQVNEAAREKALDSQLMWMGKESERRAKIQQERAQKMAEDSFKCPHCGKEVWGHDANGNPIEVEETLPVTLTQEEQDLIVDDVNKGSC